jgi:hypothetical protein
MGLEYLRFCNKAMSATERVAPYLTLLNVQRIAAVWNASTGPTEASGLENAGFSTPNGCPHPSTRVGRFQMDIQSRVPGDRGR